MGKRSAAGELFLGHSTGDTAFYSRRFIQREDELAMETKLEQIAANQSCASPMWSLQSSCSAVDQLSKSVVR
jgi:hypothetical protein